MLRLRLLDWDIINRAYRIQKCHVRRETDKKCISDAVVNNYCCKNLKTWIQIFHNRDNFDFWWIQTFLNARGYSAKETSNLWLVLTIFAILSNFHFLYAKEISTGYSVVHKSHVIGDLFASCSRYSRHCII